VGRNAFDDAEVALVMLEYLKAHYPQALQARYKLGQDGREEPDPTHWTDEDLLARIGKARGALLSGGRVDLQKAAEAAIHDFRSGALGRVSLETPQEFAHWLAEGEKLDAERTLRKEAFAEAKAAQRKSGQKKRW
jgi:ribosome biogenesis GTPase A